MSGVVVGYIDTHGGADALALGERFGRSLEVPVHIVMVLPGEDRPSLSPPMPAYERVVEHYAEQALADVEQVAPVDTAVHTEVRYADEPADGLVAAAEDHQADVLVVGAGRHGTLGRVSLGAVGNVLLHSAPVPVGLAPRGMRHHGDRPISRVTVGIGGRDSARDVIDQAIRLSGRTGAPLRLASLVTLHGRDATSQKAARVAAEEVLGHVRQALPAGIETVPEIAVGDYIEDAAAELDWDPDEVAMVGSSRLAPPRRLFLGSVANRLLRVLPVPLVVVPRGPAAVDEKEERR